MNIYQRLESTTTKNVYNSTSYTDNELQLGVVAAELHPLSMLWAQYFSLKFFHQLLLSIYGTLPVCEQKIVK